MKKIYFTIAFTLFNLSSIKSQDFYLKLGGNYHRCINPQQPPEYVGTFYKSSTNSLKASTGMELQGAFGYTFTENISLELKFSSFYTSKKDYKKVQYNDKRYSYLSTASGNNGVSYYVPSYWEDTYQWEYSRYSLLPTFLFSQPINKSTVSIFVYGGIGLNKLNLKAHGHEYDFKWTKGFSWGYGLEYSYSLTEKVNLFANIGINNSYYTPKSTYSSFHENFGPFTIIHFYDDDEDNGRQPENEKNVVVFNETTHLNSLYIGCGIKYVLKK